MKLQRFIDVLSTNFNAASKMSAANQPTTQKNIKKTKKAIKIQNFTCNLYLYRRSYMYVTVCVCAHTTVHMFGTYLVRRRSIYILSHASSHHQTNTLASTEKDSTTRPSRRYTKINPTRRYPGTITSG